MSRKPCSRLTDGCRGEECRGAVVFGGGTPSVREVRRHKFLVSSEEEERQQ